MATSVGLFPELPSTQQDVSQWLKNLPLAPEYHPTLAEFQDPIAYIFKIEKEASNYGICKIVPPVLSAPKKTAIANLNRSLSARSGSKSQPTFTTRQQQIGFCPRRPRPVKKPVWQSGDDYTFQEFEAKAKAFEKSYFRKCTKKLSPSPLEIETLYWKATLDKPFSVEYANDMPGSAFSPRKSSGKEMGEGVTVGETEWNMRGVSRAKGSLLRFMKEEIPGVTSPMVYIAMMFSWFAWHVEDHDLHSLNYLHMGAGKTWYGVPKEAAAAFEDVVRVHGYGGEINPLVTFSVLGEKTTVMSPEVFVSAGVPCCRLVQNAGEFVVTFPRAYHSGFSHGFNFGEAANIATPEWLRIAKDAAIRRASINYPPMVSHFQLLYDLALELCTRIPVSIGTKPRSSRLKDKQKGEGDTLVKQVFVENVVHNNDLLHKLGKRSSVVLLPRNSSDISVCSNLRIGSQLRVNPSPGLCRNKGIMKSSESPDPYETLPDRNQETSQVKGLVSTKDNFASLCERSRFSLLNGIDPTRIMDSSIDYEGNLHGEKLSDQRLFSCATCGILSFDCMALVQPSEAAARYLMSADCSFFNDWTVGAGVINDGFAVASGSINTLDPKPFSRLVEKNTVDGLYDVPVKAINCETLNVDQKEGSSNTKSQGDTSALGLLASNYANSSDSEDEMVEHVASHNDDETNMTNCQTEIKYQAPNPAFPSFKQECYNSETVSHTLFSSRLEHGDKVPLQTVDCRVQYGLGTGTGNFKDGTVIKLGSVDFETESPTSLEFNGSEHMYGEATSMPNITANCSSVVHDTELTKLNRGVALRDNTHMPFPQRSDEDSSRVHVFCLEHAVEVEQRFCRIGGVHVLLLCHPEYPKIEAEARLASGELGIDYLWNDVTFRDATKEDEQNIQSAVIGEEAIPGNGDWAVKLGINLFYSANLSRSSLYSKQMPYNSVIYNAFGCTSPTSSPPKFNVYGRRSGRQRKVVAGRWCGKVWMSNQVHPFLTKRDSEDQEYEQEQDRSFNGWTVPDEKFERKPKNISKTKAALTATKSGKKRKKTMISGPVKKVKQCLVAGDAASEDSEEGVSHKQNIRVYSRKQRKHIDREVSCDSLKDSSHQQLGRSHGSKPGRAVERDEASDNSLGGNSHQRSGRSLRSKSTKYIESDNDVSYSMMENNSQKQHSRVSRTTKSKQAQYFDRESEISDDSLEGDVLDGHRSFHRTQSPHFEGEDAVSDDSLEQSSPERVCRSKRAAYNEKDDANSDDSVQHSSLQHSRRISRGTQAKCIEMEDEVSDDMLEESTYRQHTGSRKSRQDNFMDREGEVSNDYLENIQWPHLRTVKAKQPKFFEREDAISDDLLESNFQQQPRVPRSKRTKFVESEDAVSDELPDDDACLKHLRIPRTKRAKYLESEYILDDLQEDDAQWQPKKAPRMKHPKHIEKEHISDDLQEEDNDCQQAKSSPHLPVTSNEEDDVSDDMQEEDTHWQTRNTPRGKNGKFIAREDVSDDLQEEDTHWQSGKTPRGKQAKLVEMDDAVSEDLVEDDSRRNVRSKPLKVLSKMKRETPRRVKRAKAQSDKKLTLQAIKQETPRLRSCKTDHNNARRFESHVEEELEGGPSTRLRKRPSKPSKETETKPKEKLQNKGKKMKTATTTTTTTTTTTLKSLTNQKNVRNKYEDAEYQCDIEGCSMSFGSKQELSVHKRNICPVKGCGKTFFSHKYLVQHRRVHLDDRPLKCPWKGCKMTFKWAWARTEHIRVHTGARPYVCGEDGCGQTFRFVSDFSRHKRKTGHSVKKNRV
ncbi:Lysine-specific demethylase REF6 [Euphorbia peplus]|nr:Lysine-specific demethylase REF6 [Euphorbia peplus]